jgi:cysteine desulfurase
MYGPKGIGGLWIRNAEGLDFLSSQILGGNQEWGLRAGTQNVPGIVGLGRAFELCIESGETERTRIRRLRDLLFTRLSQKIDGLTLNGDLNRIVPNALNLSVDGIRSGDVLKRLQHIAISSASACGGQGSISHVLIAMDSTKTLARSALRFGIGRFNTEDEIEYASERIADVVSDLRRQ